MQRWGRARHKVCQPDSQWNMLKLAHCIFTVECSVRTSETKYVVIGKNGKWGWDGGEQQEGKQYSTAKQTISRTEHGRFSWPEGTMTSLTKSDLCFCLLQLFSTCRISCHLSQYLLSLLQVWWHQCFQNPSFQFTHKLLPWPVWPAAHFTALNITNSQLSHLATKVPPLPQQDSHSLKLKKNKHSEPITGNFFDARVTKKWTRLPVSVVYSHC